MANQHEGRDDAHINDELATGVKEMQVTCESGKTMKGANKEEWKERVSFGTNMSTDEESSVSESVKQDMHRIEVAITRIHSRKIAVTNELTKGKRLVLKVQGAGTKKRQKTPNKSSIREALEAMSEEEGVGK
jgi:ABC-type molybdate transport system ATPase subunit